MSSKEVILKLIKKNQPDFISLSLPTISSKMSRADILETFTKTMNSVGGNVQIIKDLCVVKMHLEEMAATGNRVVNRVQELNYPVDALPTNSEAVYYENIYVACIKGVAGVAENAAIWLDEECMGNRLIPFICQHLVLVLYRNTIVENMHEVYKTINVNSTKYGAFVAGPSKTADRKSVV